MYLNSGSTVESRSYVWSYPGCPVRIHLSFAVIEQLREDIEGSGPQDRESGGLLIGSKRSRAGDPLNVIDFVPLQLGVESAGSFFTVSASQLEEVVERCPSDSEVVGYYRTSLDGQVRLRREDVDCIHAMFRNPLDAFLVIAPRDGGRASAGFFVWQEESVAYDPYLIFPFSTAELLAGKWPTRADATLGGSAWARAVSLFHQTSALGKAAIAVALLAAATAFFLPQSDTSASMSKAPTPARLGLRVERDAGNFLIAWERSVPEIVRAKAGNLLISDGNGPPTFVSLTPEQLRQGALTYTSTSLGEKVEFQLDVLEASGPERTESIISISGAPAPGLKDESASPVVLPRKVAPPSASRREVATAGTPSPRKIFVAPKTKTVAPTEAIPEPPAIAPNLPAPVDTQVLTDLASAPKRGIPPGPSQALLPKTTPERTVVAEPTSGITITSEPSGARVEINGVLAGYTPLTIKVSPLGLGFTVTVAKDGYGKWVAQTFSTAEPSSLHAQLRELPRQR